jgi:ATP-dependent RNA helicase RhlB
MLFVNTKREAESVVERLNRNGFPSDMISGDIAQNKRMRILEDFKAGKLPILVATDVASRGIHVDDVSHVFNYDLPQDAEDYVHRIGRTARAGAYGKAYAFADEEYVFSLEPIQEYIKMKIPVVWPDEDMFAKEKKRTPEERRAAEERNRIRREERAALEARRGGRGGGRDSGRGGPSSGRLPERRPSAPRPAGPKPPQAERPKPAGPTAEGGEAAAAAKKKRRRRKPSGPKPEGGSAAGSAPTA